MANFTLQESDLRLEMWLRARESGKLVWTTKDGRQIPLKDMSDTHLINALNKMTAAAEFEEIAAEYAGEGWL